MIVYEKRVLRRISGPKRDEVAGDWRKLQSEGHNDLYSPSIIQVIKSRRMEWVEHVARMGEVEVQTGFLEETYGKETTWQTQE